MPHLETSSPRLNAHKIFIIDQKHLTEAIQSPEGNITTEILRTGLFIKKLHHFFILNIPSEVLEEIAHLCSSENSIYETIEVNGENIKLVPQYHKPIITLMTACKIDEKDPTQKDKRNSIDATLELISRRKIDIGEVVVISDGNSILAKKIKEKGITVKIIEPKTALTELDGIFNSITTF